MKSYYKVVLTVAVFILISLPSLSQKQYYKNIVDTIITDDGRMIIAIEVPGIPPTDYRAPVAESTRTMVTLPLVPAFNWCFGCSATSGAMIAGHYDNMGYPNMYNGPTNNGIMPMDNSDWSDTIISGENRHRCPLSATSQWLDERTTAGHVDDYWISYGSIGPDPWTVAGGGSGIEHTHGDCTGDFMKTNQWIQPNPNGFNSDGSTRFYYWNDGSPITASQMVTQGIDDEDGCYGMKLFFESRGYTVVDVFNQQIVEEGLTYGFSYNDFKAEIDAGRPVFIHVTNHTMVGYGYDDGGGTNTVYIHDTWDYSNHTMIWAGSYQLLDHYAVSCFELQASTINVWNGNVHNYWANSGNWSLGHIPTAAETVVIPDLNTPCIVDYFDEECNYLDIYPGAILRIMDQELEVWNDLDVYGEIEFNNNAAVLTVHDDIDWKSASVMDVNTSSGFYPVINVYGNWEDREGCFIQMDNGVVDFMGSSNSWIRTRTSSNYFNHLKNNKTGTAVLGISSSCTEDCVVNGNIFMYSGSELQSNSSSVALIIDGYLNNIGGNIRLASGTLKFTGNPTVGLKPNTGDYLNNLIIDIGSSTLSLDNTYSSELWIKGDMTITSGVLDVSADNCGISLDGNWTNNVGDAGFIERQGIVTFQGGTETDINTDETFWDLKVDKSSVEYWALEIDANRTVNVTDDLDVIDGTLEMNNYSTLNITDLYIRANAGLNAYLDTGLEINIQGSWYDYNAAFDDWIGFKAGTSTVTFNGSANQFLNNYTDITEVFYHLIIDNSGGDFRPHDAVKVRGDLSIDAGDWWDAVASLNHYFEGDFTVDPAAGFYSTTSNTVNFTGTADQSVSFPGAATGYFYNVIVNKVSSKSENVLKNGAEEEPALPAEGGGNRSMQVNMASEIISLNNGSLVIEEGTLNLNGHYYRCTGDVTINDGGTLSIDANAWLEVGGGNALSVNNGGTLEVIGSSGNEALIEGHNDLLYNFFVNSGGTISAEYAIFEEMAGVGLNVMDGGIVDLSHPFDFCTFKLGDAGAGTSALTINNNQTLTISGAVFPANTCDYNVSKTIDQGSVTLSSVSGSFAGPTYEDDGFGRIHWSEHGMWTGTVSIYWNTTGNWGFDIVPDVNVDVVIPAGCPNYPVLSGNLGINSSIFPYDCKSLNVEAGGELTIATAHDIRNYGQITCNGKMYIGNDIYTYSTSVINIYDTIYLGSASYEGKLTMFVGSTINQYSGDLFVEAIDLYDGCQFNGYGGITHIYKNGTAPATQNIEMDDPDSYFYDFDIDASANVALYDCTYDLEVGGQFFVKGSFTPDGFDVNTDYMDVSGDLTIATGNITVSNNGPFFHSGSVLNMSGGTIDGGNNIVFYTGAVENVSGGDISVERSLYNDNNIFTPTGGTFTFNTTTSGSINDNTQFYNLSIDKGTGTLESGSEGNGVDIHVLNDLVITSGTFELNSPTNLTIDNDIHINASGTLDADDAPTVNIFVGDDWFDNNYSTGFIAGSNSVVTFNSTSNLQQVCEKSYFNTFVIDAGVSYVRPSTPGYPVIYCDSMHIENGTLRIGGYRVVVDDDLTIAGNLRMDFANDTLEIGNNIVWQSGSTDLVTDGKIFIGYDWTFEDGTSAQLGTGNTVIFNGSTGAHILCEDEDAEFGTLDINKSGGFVFIHAGSSYDMNVAGNMYVRAGNAFWVQGEDLFVLGELVNEATSEMHMMLNGNIETDSEFTLNGLLDVDQGTVLVHGTFELATTGTLTIDGGSFIDDAPHDAGNIWPPIAGTFNLTGGLFEITNYNTSFESGGTFNISGGTIRNGRAFKVASSAIFQPTGGVVDLTGTLGATAICTMPNYFYELTINHTTGYRYFPGNTEIKRDLTINGGALNLGGNELYIGDDWTNNVGSAGFVAALGKVIFNGLNQEQDVSGINTFYDVVDNSSGTKFVRFYDLSTIDNSMEINHLTRIVGSMDVNGTTDFNNASAQMLVTGTFETDILNQGGNLTVTGGNFTAFDLSQDNLLGNYLLNSGTIDLYQDLAQNIDLDADITINSGDFNVHGGSTYSIWPATGTTPTLTMSGGTLDFKDQGLWLNSNNLTANISGGLIRTSDFFQTISTNFMPTGGTIEMYGPLTAYTQHGAGSNFYHLKINKDPGSWVWAYSPLDIKGDLEVAGGEFNTNGYQVDVGN